MIFQGGRDPCPTPSGSTLAHDMLKFEIICFLKVNNEDESFKSSAREFHSLMDDRIQEICEILVRL